MKRYQHFLQGFWAFTSVLVPNPEPVNAYTKSYRIDTYVSRPKKMAIEDEIFVTTQVVRLKVFRLKAEGKSKLNSNSRLSRFKI